MPKLANLNKQIQALNRKLREPGEIPVDVKKKYQQLQRRIDSRKQKFPVSQKPQLPLSKKLAAIEKPVTVEPDSEPTNYLGTMERDSRGEMTGAHITAIDESGEALFSLQASIERNSRKQMIGSRIDKVDASGEMLSSWQTSFDRNSQGDAFAFHLEPIQETLH